MSDGECYWAELLRDHVYGLFKYHDVDDNKATMTPLTFGLMTSLSIIDNLVAI